MNLIRPFFLPALAIGLLATVVFSQEPSRRGMLDYLKPGMHVGLQQIDGSPGVALNIYGDDQLLFARSLFPSGPKGMDAREFAKSHPAIRERLAEIQREPAAQTLDIRVFADPVTIGRIIVLGSDYLLIELDDRSKRRLIPKASIAHIDLDSDPVNFVFVRRDVVKNNGG